MDYCCVYQQIISQLALPRPAELGKPNFLFCYQPDNDLDLDLLLSTIRIQLNYHMPSEDKFREF